MLELGDTVVDGARRYRVGDESFVPEDPSDPPLAWDEVDPAALRQARVARWCAICQNDVPEGGQHDGDAHQRNKEKRDEAKGGGGSPGSYQPAYGARTCPVCLGQRSCRSCLGKGGWRVGDAGEGWSPCPTCSGSRDCRGCRGAGKVAANGCPVCGEEDDFYTDTDYTFDVLICGRCGTELRETRDEEGNTEGLEIHPDPEGARTGSS